MDYPTSNPLIKYVRAGDHMEPAIEGDVVTYYRSSEVDELLSQMRPPEPSTPRADLETIAAIFQHWLDFDATRWREHCKEEPTDDVHMSRSMPETPRRSVVKAWVAALRAAQPPSAALALVRKQAEDDGLWFQAATAPEAYLQQELRKLHAAVEGVTETKSVTDDFKRKTIEQMNEITGDGRPVEKPACRACKGTGRIETGTVVNGVAEVVACDCTPDETSEVSVRATPPTGRPPVTHGTPYAIEPGETAAHKPWCDSLRFIAGADVHLACNCRPVETSATHCPHGYTIANLKDGTDTCRGCCQHNWNEDAICRNCGAVDPHEN